MLVFLKPLDQVIRSWVKRKPRAIGAKFELRYESLKSKFSLILFAYNLMIGYSKKKEKIILEGAFDKKKTNPG